MKDDQRFGATVRAACCLLNDIFLLCLLFDHQNGGDNFHRNVD
jgi:hypothetical protein